MRTVLYTGTKNIYSDMVTASKSLLYHNGADRVIFMTEDDIFPEQLPPCIINMNVSNQQFFPSDGPNYKCRWTYMVMMRAALTKIFPNLHRIIHLDHDTIVRKPINFLWDVDISGYYFAAVEEKHITGRDKPYFNFGVVIHNLDKLRADGADDTIIRSINSVYFPYCEQDAVNTVCRKHILSLPEKYNAMSFNTPPVPEDDVVIKHYAGRNRPLISINDYKHYGAMPWDEVLQHKKEVIHNDAL